MRSTVWLAAGLLAASALARGASVARQVGAIYEPWRMERAALAPDGGHLAITVRESRGVALMIYDTATPGKRVRVPFEARSAAEIRLLQWTGPDNLVVASDTPVVLATDAMGAHARVVLNAQSFAATDGSLRPRVRLLGLAGDDPGAVLIETARPTQDDIEVSAVRVDLLTGEQRVARTADFDWPGGSLLTDRQGRPRISLARGELPQRFRYLPAEGSSGWRPLDRLVTDQEPLFNVSPRNFVGHRAIPLGFDYDPNVLYYASNAGRDTFGVYALDLRTGKKIRTVAEENGIDLVSGEPFSESGLVFDRARRALVGLRVRGLQGTTRWLDPELARTQATLEEKFPGRTVQVLEWDDARERFLTLVATDSDPGRFFIYQRSDGRCVEYARRAVLDPEEENRTESFAFAGAGGVQITGYLTRPHRPPTAHPALVVWLHDGPWERVAPGYRRDAQALAAMGFLVAELNYRGSTGFGVAQAAAIQGAFDRGPIDDVRAALVRLAERVPFDAKRVAIGGDGFGGYLALRALQLHPDVFRAGVAMNAPLDLAQLRRSEREEAAFWSRAQMDSRGRQRSAEGDPDNVQVLPEAADQQLLAMSMVKPRPIDFDLEVARTFYGSGSLSAFAVDAHPEQLNQPVFFLHDPRNPRAGVEPVRSFYETLQRRKQPVQFASLPPQAARSGAARATVFRRIGEFLNTSLYDFRVKVGDVVEKEDAP